MIYSKREYAYYIIYIAVGSTGQKAQKSKFGRTTSDKPRKARHEDDMLEFRRPEPNAALTWTAVWLVALIALALMPMDGGTTTTADFAANPAMQGEIQYTHGTYTKPQGVAGQTVKIPG